MKLIIFCILVLPTYLYGQKINSTFGVGQSNIYNDALVRFVTILKEQDKNYKDYLDTLFIEGNNFLNENDIPRNIQGIPNAITQLPLLYERQERADTFLMLYIYPLAFHQGVFSVFIGVNSNNIGVSSTEKKSENPLKWKNGISFNYCYKQKTKVFIYKSFEYPKVITAAPEE